MAEKNIMADFAAAFNNCQKVARQKKKEEGIRWRKENESRP